MAEKAAPFMQILDRVRHAFLRHAPQRHALMLPPNAASKYIDLPTPIADPLLLQHLTGAVTLAAPAAHADMSCLLPLDIDAGGLDAIKALLASAAAHGLWAFGQYCPRPDWPDAAQRGYVWLVFDSLTDMRRLTVLGHQLVTEALLPAETRVEVRASHADTRLPMGRHTHTTRFGQLLLPNVAPLDIDTDPQAALVQLLDALQENPSAALPDIAADPTQTAATPIPGDSDLIRRYNAETDLRGLLIAYGGRRAAYTSFHCPCGNHTNDDTKSSLGLVRAKNARYGAWLAKGFSERCAFFRATDAFGVYCTLEGIDAPEGVKRLAAHWGLSHPTHPLPAPPTVIPSDGRRRALHTPAQPPQYGPTEAAHIREDVWKRLATDTTLVASMRTVCITLLERARDSDHMYCQLTIQHLVQLTQLATRTVQLATRRLEQHGYLTITPDATPQGGDRPNIYCFTAAPATLDGSPPGGGCSEPGDAADKAMRASPTKLKNPLTHGDPAVSSDSTGRGGRGAEKSGAVQISSGETKKPPPMAAQPPARRATPRATPAAPPAAPPAPVFAPGLIAQVEAILASADYSGRWLLALQDAGIDFADAAAIATKAGKRAFAQGLTATGRKRMWQAKLLRERMPRPTPTTPPVPAAPPTPQRAQPVITPAAPTPVTPPAPLITPPAAPLHAAQPGTPLAQSPVAAPPAELAPAPAQPTPAATRLAALGLYPGSIRRLAHVPLATIERALALAHAAPGGRDIPSLVVGFLTAHLAHGWTIPDPAPLAQEPSNVVAATFDLAKYMPGGKYGDFFHIS